MDTLLKFLCVVCIGSTIIRTSESKNSFLLTAPKVIRPGRDYTTQWRLLITPNKPVSVVTAIITDDGTKVVELTTTSSAKDEDVNVNLKVPSNLDSSKTYSLSVTVTGGVTFKEKQRLQLEQKSISIYIQTDKPIYKPGQPVNFRVFAVTPDLKIVYDKVKVEIFDPKDNKINQWDISGSEMTSQGGVYIQRQAMSEYPELGEWKIKVQYLSYKQPKEVQPFKIDEYVLPKFEVTLDLPTFGRTADTTFKGKVKAKYTFGKPVKGEATLTVKPKRERWSWKNKSRVDMRKSIEMKFPIDGEEPFTLQMSQLEGIETLLNSNTLIFDVNVTETLTKSKQGDVQEVTFYDKPHKVEFPKSLPDTFKPGMTYDCVVKVALRDGSPPGSTNEDLSVIITEYWRTKTIRRPWEGLDLERHTRRRPWKMPPRPPIERETSKRLPAQTYGIPLSGIVQFPISVKSKLSKIKIEAKYNGVRQTKMVKKRHSPSSTYIQVTSTQQSAQAGQPMQLKVKTTSSPNTVYFMIYGKGRLIKSGEINTTGKTTTWSPMATAVMAPRARIVVYYVKDDGEIIADVLTVNVEGVFKNKVSISFDRPSAAPSDALSLDITADGGSKVNVLAVDKSVLLMGSGNDITQSKVTGELRQFDTESSRSKGSRPVPICDWFCWHWPLPSSGEDVKDVFEDAGLVVMTDALVYEYVKPPSPRPWPRPLPMFRFRRLRKGRMMALGGARAMASPVMNRMPDMARAASVKMPDLPLQPTQSEELAPVGRTRKLFPETWLWKSADMPPSGQLSSQEVVPDTITSWVATAFAVHPESGLGLSESATQLEVSMPFFITVNLPYSVVRGEKVVLQVNVHNFNPRNVTLDAHVTLQMSADFENILISSTGQTLSSTDVKRTVVVGPNEIVAAYFPIIPRTIGQIDLNINARTHIMSDSVTRKLRVEAEGTPREYNLPFVMDLKEQGTVTHTAQVTFPARTVQGSQRVVVSVIGDLMGPSIKGLDKLLKMPYGCGEQNMLKFAPNIFIVKYMESTRNLDGAILTKAKEFMETGYQRELTFMHPDGSFSAFGDRDPSGSSWLTAFVLKSFVQAKPYIFIDDDVIHKSVDWLVKQQNSNGSFNEPGRVIHKAMQGGSTSGHTSLTAYILISLVEARAVAGVEAKTTAAETKAVDYLESQVTEMTDVYDLAIVYYCLTLVGSPRAADVRAKLDTKAISQDGSLHWVKQNVPVSAKPWERRKGMAVNIELTSYVLLALAVQSDRITGVQVLKWLTEQRNPDGGFSSTQDTVVALHSLSEMASLIYSPSYNLQVNVTGTGASEMFQVNNGNALMLQTRKLPVDVGTVTITASGQGLALAQIEAFYNIDDDDQKQSFQLTVNIPKETEYEFDVNVCARWLDEGSSSMAVLEIGSPSGFFPEPSSLVTSTEYKRQEPGDRKIVLYFDEIGPKDTCVTVTMHKIFLVAGAQPVPVHVYDYYEPSKQVTEFYVPETLRTSDVCDVSICGTECDFCAKR